MPYRTSWSANFVRVVSIAAPFACVLGGGGEGGVMYIVCFVTPDFVIDCIMICVSSLSLPFSLIIMVNILTYNIVVISYEVYRYGFLFNCTTVGPVPDQMLTLT